jgi:hypothetical protein
VASGEFAVPTQPLVRPGERTQAGCGGQPTAVAPPSSSPRPPRARADVHRRLEQLPVGPSEERHEFGLRGDAPLRLRKNPPETPLAPVPFGGSCRLHGYGWPASAEAASSINSS